MFADLRWPGWVDLPFDVMSVQICKDRGGFLPDPLLPAQNWADIFSLYVPSSAGAEEGLARIAEQIFIAQLAKMIENQNLSQSNSGP